MLQDVAIYSIGCTINHLMSNPDMSHKYFNSWTNELIHATVVKGERAIDKSCPMTITDTKTRKSITVTIKPKDVKSPEVWLKMVRSHPNLASFLNSLEPRATMDKVLYKKSYQYRGGWISSPECDKWNTLEHRHLIAISLSDYIMKVIDKHFTPDGLRKIPNRDVWLTPSAKIRIIRRKPHKKIIEVVHYYIGTDGETAENSVQFDLGNVPCPCWKDQLCDEIMHIMQDTNARPNEGGTFIDTFVTRVSLNAPYLNLVDHHMISEDVETSVYTHMRQYWGMWAPRWMVSSHVYRNSHASAVGTISMDDGELRISPTTKSGKHVPNFYNQKTSHDDNQSPRKKTTLTQW